MAEDKPSRNRIPTLEEQLSQDGHPIANAVSLIVSQVASVRGLFASPIEADFELLDAQAGKKNKASQVAHRIEVLGRLIGNQDLVGAATQAGIYSSENQRKALKDAGAKGYKELRDIALNMTVPAKPGEQPVTLASKIQALATK